MTEKKKNPLNLKNVVIVLIVVLSVCLLTGIVLHFNDDNSNEISAFKSNASVSTSEAPVDVPDTCADVNSYQYLLNKKVGVLSAGFVPDDLVDPENVESTAGVITLRKEPAAKLEEMVKAAKDAGVTLYVTTAYRSYKDQELEYSSVATLGEATASMTCEKAGYSEHQLGLAVDFSDSTDTVKPSTSFAKTDAGKWLQEHAHEYGFILRYPEGKEKITGYNFTPWHYRFVGVDEAKAMYAEDPAMTMEEYYNVK